MVGCAHLKEPDKWGVVPTASPNRGDDQSAIGPLVVLLPGSAHQACQKKGDVKGGVRLHLHLLMNDA